jgi:predicted CopG family antitoxin
MPKQQTTIQIDADVLEFLKSRRNGNGSVSRQLEALAIDLMQRKKDQKTLDEQHRLGYERSPVQPGEFFVLGTSSL